MNIPRTIFLAALKHPAYRLTFRTYQISPIAFRSLPFARLQYSTTGYGDDTADPHAKTPEKQGVSQKTRQMEHPGPPEHKSSGQSQKTSGSQGQGQSQEKRNTSESAKGKNSKQKSHGD